ncbi:MAG: TIGR03960 family B12-binding radical SAM protein [Nitrospinae bacterium]|nr:TIGR03960 family B12-binding radical SAM protein [Nitrospinota bacterium]
MTEHPYEALLDAVHNPSQYVGNERRSVVKDRKDVVCRVALCFPELYGIGMSHLGLKILYSILNKDPRLWAERFFAPEPDMEELLKRRKIRLASLESHDPLCDFDVVGFAISTELCFTGILTMLDLGGIPLKSAQRGAGHPLVIGGGAAVFNPEPIADFFDLFVLGDGEEVLPALALKTAELKKAGTPRDAMLRELSRMTGVYVPSLFNVEYDGVRIKSISPVSPDVKRPRRAILDDLSKSPFPYDMVIPYGQPVFDRLSVEIDRGCTGGCRFCQAGMTYRPVRERTADDVTAIISRGVRETGFDDVTLASLSSGDYSSIEQLTTRVMNATEGEHVSVSLPSLRSGTLTDELIRQVARERRTGFTITAEAGTQRLRDVINKKITDEEIVETARRVLAGGWRMLKMYFMIGLPTETDEDVEGILRLVREITSLKEHGARFQAVNVGVSQFVPKAHTPFQWAPMEDPESLMRKKSALLGGFRRIKGAKMKGHEVEMSYLEGVFSRGDRRLANVVLSAYQKGCRLDGWSEHFRLDLWMEAFEDVGLNPDDYALRKRDAAEILPWDVMDVGVSKKYLLRDLREAEKGVVTGDCRRVDCLGCGLPANDNVIQKPLPPETAPPAAKPEPPREIFRYRLNFRKERMAKYLSHLEMVTAFSRAVRRAGLPMAYSSGFHPHQRMSFGSALPVGVVSLAESLDLEFHAPMEPSEIREKLNKELEEGLCVNSVERMSPPYRSIQSSSASTVWEIVDVGDAAPSLDEVRASAGTMEGVVAGEVKSEGGVSTLRLETRHEGILGKLKKAAPGFAISNKRQLVKRAVLPAR